METKSRYEALADLEKQKRDLMQGKFNLDDELKAKSKELKIAERNIEDMKEDFENFKETLEARKLNFDGLIEAVEKGIEVFGKQLQNSQKK